MPLSAIAAMLLGACHISTEFPALFAYVNNSNSHQVSVFSVNSSDWSMQLIQQVDSNGGDDFRFPDRIEIHPNGRFVYVATNPGNMNLNVVMVYKIMNDGTLALVQGEPHGVTPYSNHSLTLSPDGKSLYANGGPLLALVTYSVDAATGAITEIQRPSTGTGSSSDIEVRPDGRFVYSCNNSSSDISVFDRAPDTGLLTLVPAFTISTSANPHLCEVHPSGRYFYVPGQSSGVISQYRIDQGTGELIPLNPATVATSGTALDILAHPDGHVLYLTNQSLNLIRTFAVRSDGTLNLIQPLGVGGAPHSLAMGLSSHHLFASRNTGTEEDLIVLLIDGETGKLRMIGDSPPILGLNANGLSIGAVFE